MTDASRVPVIIGVGQVEDRSEQPDEALDTVALLVAALKNADRDAGGNWLSRADSLFLVDHLSFKGAGDSHELVARNLGIAPRLIGRGAYPGGETPVLLLNEATNRIGAGELGVALIAGGEALRTEAKAVGYTVFNAPRRETRLPQQRSLRSRYGLTIPANLYPLYENASRAALGQSFAEAQAESAEIWSLSSQVAANNPHAWIRKAYTASEIIAPSPQNRPIAFPYNKLMVANSSVNMAAAVIVTSLEIARRAGVPAARMVFVGLGAAANESDNFLERDRYDRSTSMDVSINTCLEINGLTADDIDHVELYSCFPVIPKLSRRILGWPATRPTTVYGGLTFGGGPIGAPMVHAIACMVETLRAGGTNGLIFANGGFANHNHSIVLTRTENAGVAFPQTFDFQSVADKARAKAPRYQEGYTGAGFIETYTVFYDRAGAPTFGVVVGRTPDHGTRFLAKVPGEDSGGIAFLTSPDREPVGARGEAVATPGGEVLWRCDTGG